MQVIFILYLATMNN